MNDDADFIAEAISAQSVFTLTVTDRACQLVFQDAGGTAFPFWSSPLRAEQIRRSSPRFEHYALREVFLANFLRWLVQLESEHIRIGWNWSSETFARRFEESPSSDRVCQDSLPAITLKERLEKQIDEKTA
ncbi:hypothetical protein CfE428DRAFT_3972 [Chthoniobacter flavus Ellin428]|uniref:DUF2750 domain-containing protein n=1 Tax=Chthoniobacter flavus Ellin428 TaxID=497964 RepID=B4D4Y4_9BACT|nr:DUF2750 domain-containing protein [Chthoniobacter flavus]EDY18587.1 hypothetical protein CfE428DRAFT_3972 [Chthoniobacter flavus Ellin428]TCO90958.1 uncharacterized protein DUF2750 [Chthoniobacter flavus]